MDFDATYQDYFALDEGTDVGLADIHTVTEAVAAGAGIWDLADMEQHARFLAINAWTGHYDSYSYYSNNYRVYFDPANAGKAVFLPWDPDWAFYENTNINGYYGHISEYCRNDDECWAVVQETIESLDASVADSQLAIDVQTAIDLIEATLDDDPMAETSTREIHSCQGQLFDWFDEREGALDRLGW